MTQRKGQKLINYVYLKKKFNVTKHKTNYIETEELMRSHDVTNYIFNMSNAEFDEVLKEENKK